MMKLYVDKYAVCPFYLQESGLKIHCSEGYIPGNYIENSFVDKALKKTHKRHFCNNIYNYKACPYFNVINNKYV